MVKVAANSNIVGRFSEKNLHSKIKGPLHDAQASHFFNKKEKILPRPRYKRYKKLAQTFK